MGTRIKSEEETWQSLASKWNSGEVSSIADDFTDAYNAAMRVKDAARTIGRDIGLNVYLSEIGELRRRQQIMAETTPSIHAEVDELIDNPFVRELSSLLENLYALNPSDITVSEGGADTGGAIRNLTMLLSSLLACDPVLQGDFNSKVKNLDEDEMPKYLKEIYLDALISAAWREGKVTGIPGFPGLEIDINNFSYWDIHSYVTLKVLRGACDSMIDMLDLAIKSTQPGGDIGRLIGMGIALPGVTPVDLISEHYGGKLKELWGIVSDPGGFFRGIGDYYKTMYYEQGLAYVAGTFVPDIVIGIFTGGALFGGKAGATTLKTGAAAGARTYTGPIRRLVNGLTAKSPKLKSGLNAIKNSRPIKSIKEAGQQFRRNIRFNSANKKMFVDEVKLTTNLTDAQIETAYKALKRGDYETMAKQFDFSTPKDGTVCWSKDSALAKDFAEGINGKTINMTDGGKFFTDSKWLKETYTDSWGKGGAFDEQRIWEGISEEFAGQAQGKYTM